MKPFSIVLLILFFAFLSACAASKAPAADTANGAALVVSGGEISKSYTRADLEALAVTQSIFKDVTYQGVAVTALLEDAGFDLSKAKAIKAVASDGYSVNYDTSQVLVEGVIVAYVLPGGDMAAEDGSFRMVLPDAEGKLNIRMLAELQVIE